MRLFLLYLTTILKELRCENLTGNKILNVKLVVNICLASFEGQFGQTLARDGSRLGLSPFSAFPTVYSTHPSYKDWSSVRNKTLVKLPQDMYETKFSDKNSDIYKLDKGFFDDNFPGKNGDFHRLPSFSHHLDGFSTANHFKQPVHKKLQYFI